MKAPTFTQVPNDVLLDRTLSERARFTYALLLSLREDVDGWTRVTYPQLAELHGSKPDGRPAISPRRLQDRVRELAAAGHLEWMRGRYGKPNRYRCLTVPASRQDGRQRPDESTAAVDGHQRPPKTDTSVRPYKTNTENGSDGAHADVLPLRRAPVAR